MIVVENLTRRFNQLVAVDNLSFTIKAGEIVGFLGPNGAGKSTVFNMILNAYLSTKYGISIRTLTPATGGEAISADDANVIGHQLRCPGN